MAPTTNGNHYDEKSILKILALAHEKKLMLPSFQRDYVWDIEQIEELFESILQGYPIGSFIFWKTSRKTLNDITPDLYYFFNNFTQNKTTNDRAVKPISEEQGDEFYIVLDGQQRITSLYIGLQGSYTYFARGKGRQEKYEKYWYTKELYYDLRCYDKMEQEPGGERIKKFRFLKKEEFEENPKDFFKISDLIKDDDSNIINDTLYNDYPWLVENPAQMKKVRSDLTNLFLSLRDPRIIHFYSIEDDSYDNTLDIFVKVNSSGTALSTADLIFSTLINEWKDVKKEDITKFLAKINGNDFKFTRDYLIRFALLAVGAPTSLKITSFQKTQIEEIHNSWKKIQESLKSLSNILKAIGICHEQILSYNATMVIAYYIFKDGIIDIKDRKSLKNIQKYLWVAFAKNLFAGSSDTSLNNIRSAIDDHIESLKSNFPLSMFSDIRLSGGRNFVVNETDIDEWLTHKKGEDKVFLILSLLYPNLKLDQIEFHQDHCHPYEWFNKIQNFKNFCSDPSDAKAIQEKWKEKRDCIPNLQLLEGSENQIKSDTALKEWVAEDPLNRKIEYLPPEKPSLEFKDFEEFFEARKKEMKKKLLEIFEVPSNQQI